MQRTKGPEPPTGVTRVLFRLPTVLYRLHLGWLLGGRFLLLGHVGRRSGRRRRVVLEVVEHDAAAGTYTIVSGYGTRADWYRNLLAHPRVELTVGGRRRRALAVPVAAGEGGEVLLRYARRHPRAIRGLVRFTGFQADGSDAGYRRIGEQLVFLRLEPDPDGGTPA